MDETVNDYSSLKRRYRGLDVFRVVSASIVCMFHTTIHLGCDYGILQSVSRMGAVFMTGFFMLSGFVLFTNWAGTSLTNFQDMVRFWKKRIIKIMPIYWLVALIYVLVMLVIKRETPIRTLVIAPVEILGIQSVFHSLFEISHNGGTWFISCLLICYALYPYLQEIVKNLKLISRYVITISICLIILYSPLIVRLFNIEDIYSNTYFRLLEFSIGILIATIKIDLDSKGIVFIYKKWFIILVSTLMLISLTIAVKMNIAVGNYMLYNYICLPCFILIILGLSGIDCKESNDSSIIKTLSNITYSFFLAQLFSNEISAFIIENFTIDENSVKIIIGWSICIIIAIIIHILEITLNSIIIKCNKIKYVKDNIQ